MGIRRGGLDEFLKEAGLDETAIAAVQETADKQSITMGEAATQTDSVDPAAVAQALSRLSGLPVLATVDAEIIESEMIRKLPLSLARDNGILPLYLAGDELVIGVSDCQVILSVSRKPPQLPNSVSCIML